MTEMHTKLRGLVDSTRANRIELTLSTEPGQDRVTLLVFSACKPAFARRLRIADQGADDRTARVVAASAGAAAEYLNETYRDRLDPEQCARTALKLFSEALRQLRLDEKSQVTDVLQ